MHILIAILGFWEELNRQLSRYIFASTSRHKMKDNLILSISLPFGTKKIKKERRKTRVAMLTFRDILNMANIKRTDEICKFALKKLRSNTNKCEQKRCHGFKPERNSKGGKESNYAL